MDVPGSDFVGHDFAGRDGRDGVRPVDARAGGLLATDGRVGVASGGYSCRWTLVLLRDGCNGVGHRKLVLLRDGCDGVGHRCSL